MVELDDLVLKEIILDEDITVWCLFIDIKGMKRLLYTYCFNEDEDVMFELERDCFEERCLICRFISKKDMEYYKRSDAFSFLANLIDCPSTNPYAIHKALIENKNLKKIYKLDYNWLPDNTI